jgi:DNA modification methylase
MQIERVEIGKLTGDPANARKHGERNIDTIVQSLNRFGQQKPIVVDSSFCVRAGNGTLEAARSLGWTHLDCVVTDLKGSDAVAYAIADNRTAELAEWDDGVLAAVLEGLQLEGLLESVGFSDDEFAELMKDIELDGDGTTGEIEEDEVPEPPDDPITKPGDLWVLGRHRLLCGDSTKAEDVARLMGGERAEMMFTDPPYGVNYEGGHFHSGDVNVKRPREKLASDENADLYGQFLPVALPHVDGPCYLWFAGSKALPVYQAVHDCGGIVSALLIWHKTNATYAAMNAQYKQRHEPCLYFKPKGSTLRWVGPSDACTLWEFKRDGKNEFHPTQKPVALAANALKNHGAETVVDFFGGSGSTLMAAEQLDRRAFLVELNPAYCDVIIKRWENLTGKKAVLDGNTGHANDGESTTATVADKARVSGSDSKKASTNNR